MTTTRAEFSPLRMRAAAIAVVVALYIGPRRAPRNRHPIKAW